MLRQKPPAKLTDENYCVLDIENLPDGTVIAIGTSWRECGHIQHRVFAGWEDWWAWLLPQANQSKIFRTIYAHNGGGWDWLSFLQWFIQAKSLAMQDDGYRVGLISAQSSLVFLTVSKIRERTNPKIKEKIEERLWTIKLCDSLYLLRSSLNDLAVKLLGENHVKTESDINAVWKAWESDKARFYRYLQADCELLLLVLEKTLALVRAKIAPVRKLGVTIGSLAMSVYQTIWTPTRAGHPIYTDLQPDVETLARQGYHGGRVEVFKHGYYKKVWVYDINSLYPFSMVQTKVPYSRRGSWVKEFRANQIGVYQLNWKQRNTSILPIFMDTSGNGCYVGSGVVYSPEIALFKSLDRTGDINIEKGWVFLDTANLFTDFVSKLYAFRLASDNPALSTLAKYLLNSLYGKFGQKGSRNSLVVFDSEESAYIGECENQERNDVLKREGKPTIDLTRLDRDELLYEQSETVKVEHAHVGIAGMITAQARVELFRMVLAAGVGNVVYCDTDSIHCLDNRLDQFVSPGLGKLKLEAVGEGVYAGKKLYAIRDLSGKTKMRAKGVSLSRKPGDFGADLQFKELVSLLDGKTSTTKTFSRPATWRGVLSGQQSCSLGLVKRKRTVRKT